MLTGVSQLWIGITDANNTNKFLVDHSGEMVNYTRWNTNEPNDRGGNEPCTYIHRSSGWKWHDVGCSSQSHVVCEHH